MIVQIDVTQADIDTTGCSATDCMVQSAVRPMIDNTLIVQVGLTCLCLLKKDKISSKLRTVWIKNFPKGICSIISKHDDIKQSSNPNLILFNHSYAPFAVGPFSFKMDIPAKYLKINVPEFKEMVKI